MVTVFVDTSALFALLDRHARDHERVVATMEASADDQLVTHAYVVVEALALVRSRLGPAAATDLIDAVLPLVRVEPVDGDLHAEASAAFRVAPGRVSFVDRTSFAFMRRERIEHALALDGDFAAAGFRLLP